MKSIGEFRSCCNLVVFDQKINTPIVFFLKLYAKILSKSAFKCYGRFRYGNSAECRRVVWAGRYLKASAAALIGINIKL